MFLCSAIILLFRRQSRHTDLHLNYKIDNNRSEIKTEFLVFNEQRRKVLSKTKACTIFAFKAIAGKTGHKIQSLTQFCMILSSSACFGVQFAFAAA